MGQYSPDFSQLVDAALRLQEIWREEELQFCFIGGLVVHHFGEARATQDIDAAMATGFGDEMATIDRLFCHLQPRISDATNFARLHRVVLGQEASGIPVDVSLAGLPYELEMIERAADEELRPGRRVRTCTASDLVILKAFASRDRDWSDIRGILIHSQRLLDWAMIQKELTMLCELKEEPEIVDRLLQLRDSTDG